MANEYDFFQFGPSSIGNDWLGGDNAPAMRPPSAKLSNYNSMYCGTRRGDDYTRTIYEFSFDENTKPELGVGYGSDWAYYEYNPYLLGSTIKKVLDDQGFKMGMSHDSGTSLDAPKYDVSDKQEVDASGMVSFKNYPTEGFLRFSVGLKNVKPGEEAGNSWLHMP